MTGETEKPVSPKRPRFWTYRRLWSAVTLVAVLVLFLRDEKPFLQTVERADYAIAGAIAPVTPGALIAGFKARAAECDYVWLVYCAAPPSAADQPSRFDCLHSDSGCLIDTGRDVTDPDTGYLAAAWRTVQTLAELPDATWYMIKTTWREGYVPFGLLIVFIVLNIVAATRVPVILWPISLSFTTALASGLFWLVQQAFLMGADGVGVLIQVLIGSYLVPHFLITGFAYIRGVNELHDAAHKTAEVVGQAPRLHG
jgi:hypothetical protein